MKILWVNPHFLHPTTKGGQIRTLEMLRHLHRWHEIHYVALENPAEPEGLARSLEYCSRAYPIPHSLPTRGSAAFVWQAAGNLLDPLPLAITRYRSAAMKSEVARLLATGTFDRLVADFLFAAPNVPSLSQALLFQHNVETTIWDRHLENAHSAVARAFFRIQRNRMARYEGSACRQSAHVVAVSSQDAQRFRTMFQAKRVSEVPTGVDITSFTRPKDQTFEHKADLVFVGSMDWLPNIDGCNYFVREILPLIRRKRPNFTLAIVGRSPGSGILEMARTDPGILVSGTVPDIRPYLWGCSVSIVPLRIGGGTRLKIYEAMAAQTPIVSTTIGAEGLPVLHGTNLYLADTPEAFAQHCLDLLDSPSARQKMAQNAYHMVSSRFSWENAARIFEAILRDETPRAQPLMNSLPTILFALSCAFLFYVILGYPLLLKILAKRFHRPIHKGNTLPSVAVIIPVRNGAQYVRRKLDSVLQLDYPRESIEVLVISDESTDATDALVAEYADRGVRLLRVPHGGKPAALNAGVPTTRNAILLLTDIRQVLAPDSLRAMVSCFADPAVGVVSGELLIRRGDNRAETNIGLYWRFETWIRNCLSDIDSMLGATGPFYAIRRELMVPMPPETLLDDLYVPLAAFFRGYRLVVEPAAKAYDDPTSLSTEFRRKVRTLAGNYQIMRQYPALLTPRNRMWIHYLSLKLGRLLLPFALIVIAITSFWLPYRWMVVAALGAQAAVYGLAIFDHFDGWLPEQSMLKRLSSVARTFVVMMLAALCSLSIFFVPPQKLWTPTKTRRRS